MAQKNFGIQQGVTLYGQEEGGKYHLQNFGGSAPDSGFGSNGDFAVDTYDGEFYSKVAGTWSQAGISSRINTAVAGIRFIEKVNYFTSNDISAFSGTGNKTLDGQTFNIQEGDRIATTSDSKIYTVPASGAWTGVSVSEKDAFFVDQVVSDEEYKQGKAIFQLQDGSFNKLADFDFEDADSIGFSEYDGGTGVDGSGTVQSAIELLDSSVDGTISTLGVNRYDSDLGAFDEDAGQIDNSTVKGAIQGILHSAASRNGSTSIQAETTIDAIALWEAESVEWSVEIEQGNNKFKCVVHAESDGSSVEYAISNIIEVGSAIGGLAISVDISGGEIRLRGASSSSATAYSLRRIIFENRD